MIEAAREFALKAHGDQKYGSQPYSVHLDAVAELAREYGEVAEIVAYLHDVVEDTDVELSAVENRFGALVAECVSILTDEPGADRQEKKRKTYAKMAEVSGETEVALIVKAADRLANLRACVADKKAEKLSVYKQEHEAFRQAAYRQDLCYPLWSEMDGIVCSHQHGGWNYRFWKGDHGLIRQRGRPGELYPPEVVALKGFWRKRGRWIQGTPAVMDAITGLGPDLWSSGGEWAEEISFEEAETMAESLKVGLFDEVS